MIGTTRSHSEETAREIDEEVRRIIDTSIVQVRQILQTRRTSLESITSRLIEAEVIDGSDLQDIIETTNGKPQLVPGTTAERRTGAIQTPSDRENEPPADVANQ